MQSSRRHHSPHGTGPVAAGPSPHRQDCSELVLIVARTPEKNRIMKAIMDGAGPKAGAIVFSLPVTDTAGLRLLEEEEPVQETSAQ